MVVEVLLENGRNLRHLTPDEHVTVAFTFRAPSKESKDAARTMLLRHYLPAGSPSESASKPRADAAASKQDPGGVMAGDCIFCRIVDGNLPAEIVYQSPDGFFAALEYAVLVPLSGLDNIELDLRAQPAQLLRLRNAARYSLSAALRSFGERWSREILHPEEFSRLIFAQPHATTEPWLIERFGQYTTIPLTATPHYDFVQRYARGDTAPGLYEEYLQHSWDFHFPKENTPTFPPKM